MLELDRIRVGQGDFSLCADFSIAGGDIIAVLGPSGAGKSTLLAGYRWIFYRVQWGTCGGLGADISTLAPAQRPISMLFQDNNLFPHMTARQNVGLGINPSLRLSDEAWARVDTALERVELTGLGETQAGCIVWWANCACVTGAGHGASAAFDAAG